MSASTKPAASIDVDVIVRPLRLSTPTASARWVATGHCARLEHRADDAVIAHDGTLRLTCDESQRAVTPGQLVAFFDENAST